MPFAPRKGRKEGWRCGPTLPGFGRVGPWQSGMRTRRDAQRVDAWLYEQALHWPEVIEGLVAGEYSLRDAWVAAQRGRLNELLSGAKDPRLSTVAGRYSKLCKDSRVKQGLATVVELAPAGARLSWLRGRNINELYLRAGKSRSEVAVYRSVHRAVRELLGFALGPQGRDEAMYGVKPPKQRSRRKVRVDGGKLRGLVDGIEDERFRWLVTAALLTAIDQGPLLRLRAEDYQDLPAPNLWIEKAKTAEREGVMALGPTAARLLRRATAGLEPEQRIFPFTKDQVSYRWGKVRKAAGLPQLRFKDLRHLLPSYLDAAGMQLEDIQRVMRHANPDTTLIYVQSQQARVDVELMEEATRLMGLEGVA